MRFSAVGSGYYVSLGKKADARLAPSQVGVFRGECAMRILRPFTSNTRLITLCSRCHHSESLHGSDPTGGPCLFSECKCQRFAPKPQPKDSPEADGELRSEVSS
jgi:hypothetical protein